MRVILLLVVGAALVWYLVERSSRRTAPMAGGLHDDVTLPHEQEWELSQLVLALLEEAAHPRGRRGRPEEAKRADPRLRAVLEGAA